MHTSSWVLVLAALLLKSTAAPAASLALVLAVDVSASVSADSYLLQRNGIARAFESPRLVSAISALPGGIEALVLEWSDPDRIAVTVGWKRITDIDSAAGFAAAVRATTRSSTGLTAIGPALLAAAAEFDRVPEPAERRVIDISGDGMANFGSPPEVARDRVVQILQKRFRFVHGECPQFLAGRPGHLTGRRIPRNQASCQTREFGKIDKSVFPSKIP